jgi:hypothetical protein
MDMRKVEPKRGGLAVSWFVFIATFGGYAVYQLKLDPLTWDSVVAVVLFGLAVLGAAVAWWYRKTEPGRTYAMFFQKHPQSAMAGDKNEPRKKSGEVYPGAEGHIVLWVCVKVNKGVRIEKCSFRLVSRHLRPRLGRLWRWDDVEQSVASVVRLWDASYEALHKNWGSVTMRGGSSRENPDDPRQHVMLYPLDWQVFIGNPRWFRVIITAEKEYDGYLEFEGPAMNGRSARTQRSVKLRPSASWPQGAG